MNHKEIERWHRLRNIKRAAQVIVALAVLALVTGYGMSRLFTAPSETFTPVPTPGDAGRIDNFSFSFPGAYPLELQAPSALLYESEGRVKLEKPRVTVPSEDGAKIVITAGSGELDEKARTVTASEGVTIRYGEFTFEAGDLEYSDGARVAETSSPVSMSGAGMFVTGEGLKLMVDSRKIVIKTNVRARLFGEKMTQVSRRVSMERIIPQ